MKKIIAIILIFTTILNLFAASFLFLDLQKMQAPDTNININLVEISSKEAKIESKLEIFNPNDFELIVKDLFIQTKSPNGIIISTLKIEGKTIYGKENITFTKISTVNYSGCSPDRLITEVTGTVGMKLGIIEKTLPISLKIKSNMAEIISKVFPPVLTLETSFGEISQENISINIKINSFNPNTFDLNIDDISVEITNETDKSMGNITIPKINLKANSSVILNGTGLFLIKALDSKILTTEINTNFSATIAGYEKKLPLTLESKIIVPDIKEILSSKIPTEAVIRGDYHASLNGLVGEITLISINPNDIDFKVKDITIEAARIDKNTRSIVSTGKIEDGILKGKENTTLSGEIVIPYYKLFLPPRGGKIIPDWLEITIRANVSIQGLNSYFWVGMVGYQDFHLFKKDKVYKNHEEIEWM